MSTTSSTARAASAPSALFGFDTVAFLCGGQMAILSRIIYALVGLAGLWCITLLFRSSDEETGHARHTA